MTLPRNSESFNDYVGHRAYSEQLRILTELRHEAWKLPNDIIDAELKAAYEMQYELDAIYEPIRNKAYHSAIWHLVPKGLPKPTTPISSGYYGTAFRTTSPKWVLKVTTSPYEADRLEGMVKAVPESTCKVLHSMYAGGETWLIWKELCDTTPRDNWDTDHQYLRREVSNYTDDCHDENIGYNSKGKLVCFDP